MRLFVLSLLLCIASFAQNAIRPGTVLPLQLNTSLNARHAKPGQIINARVMQDVACSPRGKIPAGAKVFGRITTSEAAQPGSPSKIAFRFDRLTFAHQSVPISTNLRALASMLEVEDAQIPAAGADRGTPWAWTTRNLIGGEVAYGQFGPVARGDEILGHALATGVLIPLKPNRAAGCSGAPDGNPLQATWVFSSDACGLYGFDAIQVAHAGRTSPVGEVTLAMKRGNLNIRAGAGILLQINSANAP